MVRAAPHGSARRTAAVANRPRGRTARCGRCVGKEGQLGGSSGPARDGVRADGPDGRANASAACIVPLGVMRQCALLPGCRAEGRDGAGRGPATRTVPADGCPRDKYRRGRPLNHESTRTLSDWGVFLRSRAPSARLRSGSRDGASNGAGGHGAAAGPAGTVGLARSTVTTRFHTHLGGP